MRFAIVAMDKRIEKNIYFVRFCNYKIWEFVLSSSLPHIVHVEFIWTEKREIDFFRENE